MSGVDLLVVLLAFIAGAVMSASISRCSRLRRNPAQPASFVKIERLHRRSIDGGKAYYADLAFSEDLRDVLVMVEIFRADPGGSFDKGYFMRWRLDTPLERPSCSGGTIETVQLIEARKGRPSDDGLRPFLVGGRAVGNSTSSAGPLVSSEVAFKVRLKVSASGQAPFIDEQFFRLAEEDLSHLPKPAVRELKSPVPEGVVNA